MSNSSVTPAPTASVNQNLKNILFWLIVVISLALAFVTFCFSLPALASGLWLAQLVVGAFYLSYKEPHPVGASKE